MKRLLLILVLSLVSFVTHAQFYRWTGNTNGQSTGPHPAPEPAAAAFCEIKGYELNQMTSIGVNSASFHCTGYGTQNFLVRRTGCPQEINHDALFDTAGCGCSDPDYEPVILTAQQVVGCFYNPPCPDSGTATTTGYCITSEGSGESFCPVSICIVNPNSTDTTKGCRVNQADNCTGGAFSGNQCATPEQYLSGSANCPVEDDELNPDDGTGDSGDNGDGSDGNDGNSNDGSDDGGQNDQNGTDDGNGTDSGNQSSGSGGAAIAARSGCNPNIQDCSDDSSDDNPDNSDPDGEGGNQSPVNGGGVAGGGNNPSGGSIGGQNTIFASGGGDGNGNDPSGDCDPDQDECGSSASACDEKPSCDGLPLECALIDQVWYARCGGGLENQFACDSEEYKCEGDPLLCAQIDFQRVSYCETRLTEEQIDDSQNLGKFADGIDDGNQYYGGEDVEGSQIDLSDLDDVLDGSGLGLARECISDIPISTPLISYDIPLSAWCPIFDIAGAVVLALAYFLGFQIIGRAVT